MEQDEQTAARIDQLEARCDALAEIAAIALDLLTDSGIVGIVAADRAKDIRQRALTVARGGGASPAIAPPDEPDPTNGG